MLTAAQNGDGVAERKYLRHAVRHIELRHTALTRLWQRTKDLRMVQRMARHSSAKTTEIYTHVNDDEFLAQMRKQPC